MEAFRRVLPFSIRYIRCTDRSYEMFCYRLNLGYAMRGKRYDRVESHDDSEFVHPDRLTKARPRITRLERVNM
jgi:hypothetical protein